MLSPLEEDQKKKWWSKQVKIPTGSLPWWQLSNWTLTGSIRMTYWWYKQVMEQHLEIWRPTCSENFSSTRQGTWKIAVAAVDVAALQARAAAKLAAAKNLRWFWLSVVNVTVLPVWHIERKMGITNVSVNHAELIENQVLHSATVMMTTIVSVQHARPQG